MVKKPLSSILNDLPNIQYVFDDSTLNKVDTKATYVIMGKIMSLEDFTDISIKMAALTLNLYLIPPEEISIPYFSGLLKSLCGESSMYVCEDGLIGSTASLKGYTLTLTLPVWNEAETLAGVIESFLPVADEIIIGIDDKTNDGSDEIAKKYTGQVFYFKWEKSFCKARNACLEKCATDWIFMTEGHEYLGEDSIPYFQMIKGLPQETAMVKVKRILECRKQSLFPWLIRNNPAVRYINNAHNAVISTDPRLNGSVALPQIFTMHERSEFKDNERREQRRYMNRGILLKELTKDPKDTRALFYLGNEYFDYGKFEKAISFYKRYLKYSSWDEERYQVKIFLAKCQVCMGDKSGGIDTLLSCFLEPVPRNDHMIVLADLLQDEHPESAIYYLRLATSVEEPQSPMWIDPSYYREVPLQKLCIIYGSIGRLSDALTCAKAVEKKYPLVKNSSTIISEIETALEDENKSWVREKSSFDLITV
jgi:tetratricopeptide (TPR) repeat protein